MNDDDAFDIDVPSVLFNVQPSPSLTGTLRLSMPRKMRSTARRLLGLPNGLHFPSLPELEWLWYCEGVLKWIDVGLRRISPSTVSPAWYTCLVSPLDLLLTVFHVSRHPASDRPLE